VVKCEVFLRNLKRDYEGMNRAYAVRFSIPSPPARQTIQVSKLPLDSPIEISCIAVKKNNNNDSVKKNNF
jgi:2-iminobutanoate/2-iminopropanoate deaminase